MIERVAQVNAFVFLIAFVTYPGIFFYNPFQSGQSILAYLQLASIIASFLAVALPIWGRRFYALGNVGRSLYLISFFSWPVVLIAIRVVLFLAFGDPGFAYLISYPMLFFTDLILPIFLLFLLFRDAVEAKVQRRLQNQSVDRN